MGLETLLKQTACSRTEISRDLDLLIKIMQLL